MKLAKLTIVLFLYPLSVFANISDLNIANRDGRISKRIYNGEEIYINLAPYMALVYTDSTDTNHPFCGAAIITTRHLISTAYFFKRHENQEFKVVTGRTYAFPIDNDRNNKVKKVYIHEKYDLSEIYNDIALLELWELLKLSHLVKFIKLATPESVKEMQIPAMMSVTGFGKQSNGIIGRLVRKQVQILDPRIVNNFTDRLVVLENNALNMCNGDSGNPGVIDGNLTALSIFESNFCGDHPTFFTGIPYYYEWIKTYVGAKRLEEYPDLK
ncbi:chymotrypsin-C-like isoform X2 [Belonocnema kinseyi]|uniref:chymotrypsin-C-like isoform X2 n=1 Tax=Belonocnema kinseyi TaxID=2817044 RepID=UPI00143D0851|nr:chymotrypsin-C-like isoform X2 [Belonocnema kinseyi]